MNFLNLDRVLANRDEIQRLKEALDKVWSEYCQERDKDKSDMGYSPETRDLLFQEEQKLLKSVRKATSDLDKKIASCIDPRNK